jgi:hypothetical protein
VVGRPGGLAAGLAGGPPGAARLLFEGRTVGRAGHQLQTLSALGRQLIGRYDVPPYVNSADQSGAVPFLDIGNRYVLAGAQYDPQVLAGLSAAQIAAQLRNPSSPVAQAIDGSAKVIITAINQVLHDQAGRG